MMMKTKTLMKIQVNMTMTVNSHTPQKSGIKKGILLVDKPEGITSFKIVHILRKLTGIQKIGHAGTLDPFATGLMIMLVGKEFTTKSDTFMNYDKQYHAQVFLGSATDSYDKTGTVTHEDSRVPTLLELEEALAKFQGSVEQIPPMYSAKKIQGQKLCDLARRGITVERAPQKVHIKIELVSYSYPFVNLIVDCSKGTYIRSLAYDIGIALGTYAHLSALRRTRIGSYFIEDATTVDNLSTL